MNSTGDRHTTIWLGGLPMVGTRPLTDGERATLQSVAHRCLRTYILALLLTPALFLATMVGAAIFHLEALVNSPVMYPVMLVIVCSPAITVLVTRDAGRKRKGILNDLRGGVVWVFSRPADQKDQGAPIVEVLPVSQAAWTIGGVQPAKWTPAVPGEAAETPEYAATAAQWVQRADPADERSPYFNDRELTSTELTELRRHIRRTRWSAIPWALGLDAWMLVCVWAGYNAARRHPVHTDPIAYWFCLLSLIWNYTAIARWRLAAGLARDLAIGRVVIARVPVKQGDETLLSDAFEFLPASRADWTRAGRPARWRLSPADRRKRK